MDKPLFPCVDDFARWLFGAGLWMNHKPQLAGVVVYTCLAVAWTVWCFWPRGYGQMAMDRHSHSVTDKNTWLRVFVAGVWIVTGLVGIWVVAMTGGSLLFHGCEQANANALWCDGLQSARSGSAGVEAWTFVSLAALKFLTWSAIVGAMLALMKTAGTVIEIVQLLRRR